MKTGTKAKPRIGIFTRPIDKGTSGSGHHLLEIVRNIIRINAETDQFELFLIHYKHSDNDLYKHAQEIVIPRFPLFAAWKLRPYRFDVLHHSPLTIFSPLWGTGAKRVATIHSAEPNIIPQYYTLTERAHANFIKPFYARMMDHIFTVSNTSKNYFTTHWDVRPERVSICYNAVDTMYRIEKNGDSVRGKYGIPGRYVFHVSKYSPRKNPEAILGAFSILARRDDMKDVNLVLAGSGWKNEDVEGMIEREGLSGRVIFTGFTPEEDVVGLYNNAEVFVFPSRAEGYGMPNVEAMACGCPVVTSRSFAIPEIVGDAALMIDDPDDHADLAGKIARIMTDRAFRDTLAEKGLAWVKRYSWDASARTIIGVYRELAGPGAGRP